MQDCEVWDTQVRVRAPERKDEPIRRRKISLPENWSPEGQGHHIFGELGQSIFRKPIECEAPAKRVLDSGFVSFQHKVSPSSKLPGPREVWRITWYICISCISTSGESDYLVKLVEKGCRNAPKRDPRGQCRNPHRTKSLERALIYDM